MTANVLYHHQIILKGTLAFKQLQREGWLEFAPGATYEGSATFISPRVAVLADMMRQITNFLFHRMSGIWSGKMAEPRDAKRKYVRVNEMLVDFFAANLGALESGKQFTAAEKDTLVQEAINDLDHELNL